MVIPGADIVFGTKQGINIEVFSKKQRNRVVALFSSGLSQHSGPQSIIAFVNDFLDFRMTGRSQCTRG